MSPRRWGFDPAALEDPALRGAVLAAVRLAVARLRLAADVAARRMSLRPRGAGWSRHPRRSARASRSRCARAPARSWAARPSCSPLRSTPRRKRSAALLRPAVDQLAEARAELLSTAVGAEVGQVLRGGGLGGRARPRRGWRWRDRRSAPGRWPGDAGRSCDRGLVLRLGGDRQRAQACGRRADRARGIPQRSRRARAGGERRRSRRCRSGRERVGRPAGARAGARR